VQVALEGQTERTFLFALLTEKIAMDCASKAEKRTFPPLRVL
jgi:hypothetical protein